MKPTLGTRPRKSVKRGDLFGIGPHRLLCGDASDPAAVTRLLGKERIKLLLTDPPYGESYVETKVGFSVTKARKPIANDDLGDEASYRAFTKGWFAAMKPFLERKNAFYVFNEKMLFALKDGIHDAGGHLSQLLVWVKTSSVIGRMDYLLQHEHVAYGWVGTHEFLKAKDKSILVCPKPARSDLHPTMKPVPLLRRLILNSTRKGDIVYDPFAGSGSTGIAAEQAGRRAFMIELDPEYCRAILNRFEKAFGIQAKRL